MHIARRLRFVGVFGLAGLTLLSGCATKNYVREQIAAIDPKLAEMQNQARENSERIDAVDKRAQQGIADAAAAQKAATAANAAAGQAQKSAQTAQTAADAAQKTATTATQSVATADKRITTVENRFNTLDRYTAGPTQSVQFRVGSAELDDPARKTLDGIANQVGSLSSGFMIEIQGFASSDGAENYNLGLSQRRADAVLRYLVGRNVPLFRIGVVGLGEERPAADNSTQAGRQQNRRVEVRVLRAN
jgi:outer membrane protein OmpA-like peptidoglycan-associated protein